MSDNLRSRILSQILRRWPKRFEVLAPDQCYFITVDLPDGIRVNMDFIRLNYMDLSPFAEPGVVFRKRGKRLLLWFFPQTSETIGRFVFPESYILAHGVDAQKKDSVLVAEDVSSSIFIVLKDGRFCTQLVKAGKGAAIREQTIALLSREYSLLDPPLTLLTEAKQKTLLARGFSRLGLGMLPGFRVGGESDRQRLVDVARSFAPLLLVFLLLTTLFQAGGIWLQQKRIGSARSSMEELQASAEPLLQARNMLRDEMQFWQRFAIDKTEVVSLCVAYRIISEAVIAADGKLRRWSGVKNVVTFTVTVKDAAVLLDDLRSVDSVVAIRFDGSVKKERNSGKQLANIVAEFGRK